MAKSVNHSNIVYWLLAVMLGVALLPLVFVSWRLITINRSSMSAGERATQAQLAGDRAKEIAAFFDRYLGQTASIARGLELAGSDRLGIVNAGRLEEALHRDRNVLALGVVPKDGAPIVAHADRVSDAALDALVAEGVDAVATGGRYLGRPRRTSDGHTITVMADAVRPGTENEGAVVSVIDLSATLDFNGTSGPQADVLGAHGTLVYVVDSAGAVLAHPDPSLVGTTNRRDDPLVAAWLGRTQPVPLVTTEYRGQVGGHRGIRGGGQVGVDAARAATEPAAAVVAAACSAAA